MKCPFREEIREFKKEGYHYTEPVNHTKTYYMDCHGNDCPMFVQNTGKYTGICIRVEEMKKQLKIRNL